MACSPALMEEIVQAQALPCETLDPITVKRFKETKYYEVIQGRTRVVASLHEGFTHVPVII